MEHRIRLSSRDSLLSVNKDNFVDVNLNQSTKLFPFSDVKDTIDQYEVFEDERNKCNNYRIILTINPYCTNILFNALTEIIKNEGSSNEQEVVNDINKAQDTDGCRGVINPTRNQMIMNTEYSKDSIGYEYHPGYDFFTNHILRNLTFKMVNKEGSVNNITDNWDNFQEVNGTPSIEDAFNTIGDFMRYADGEVIQYRKRLSLDTQNNDIQKERNKHLYLNDDLLSFSDSINGNLSEDNGWFGFVNNSSILAKERNKDDESKWDDMDISRVLNNRESCEFIDMYPDRTLYSFNPKYNKFKHRAEYNWNICITYPFKNDYNHPIVMSNDKKTNALKIYSITKTIGTDGADVLLVQTYTKHGLKRGDNIYFYYSDNGNNDSLYIRSQKSVKITNIGDLNKENNDYFFYTSDLSLLDEGVILSNEENASQFRFTRLVNGIESEYYIRLFRKLPNLKYRNKNLTEDIALNNTLFEEYLKNNAMDGDRLLDFDREQYQLAFASTIYNDNSTQITFTDSLDLGYIVDNLGRPLTEIYLTFVKNNKGYKEWYSGNYTHSDIEFSHCFGKVTSGLSFYAGNKMDDDERYSKAQMSDIRIINSMNFDHDTETSCYDSKSLEDYITDLNEEITYENDIFPGDLVDFNKNEVIEKVLDDVYFRFNTAQRELCMTNDKYELFQYQELTADDYDLDNFTITNHNANDENNGLQIYKTNVNTRMRPEGYFYKAHYNLPVREFGSINQSAHFDIKVKEAKPIQENGIYIRVTSTLSHGLSTNDVVYICDDNNENEEWVETRVVYVENKNNFIMNIVDKWNWIVTCNRLNSTDEIQQLKLRRKNIEIPHYASKVGKNKFLWRNVLRVGDRDTVNLPEYIFANGHFYINKVVNFFLKRQDPEGRNGLYSKDVFPNDIYGNIKQESNYEYKDESQVIC